MLERLALSSIDRTAKDDEQIDIAAVGGVLGGNSRPIAVAAAEVAAADARGTTTPTC